MDAEQKKKPVLLLLPNLIGEQKSHQPFLPQSVDKAVETLDGLIAESFASGRRYLSRFNTKKPADQITIALFNEQTPEADIDFLLEPLYQGERWGLLSDAGLPCVADPGSKVVRRARQSGIIVQAFVGPSSLLLALMLSGMPGQNFSFHGYLHKESTQREKQLRLLEERSRKDHATQIFIETPYRNQHMLESLLRVLSDDTYLCAAWELTMPGQGVVSQKVALWKKSPLPNLEKKNTVFLISYY